MRNRYVVTAAGSAFALGGLMLASPANAAETSGGDARAAEKEIEYSISEVDSKTLAVDVELDDGLSFSENGGTVTLTDSDSGKSEAMPTELEVEPGVAVEGEWELVGESELQFVITEAPEANTGDQSGVAQAQSAYWDCVAKGLQGGAIGGAVSGLVGGPAGGGMGLLAGGIGGSVAGAVTCR